MMQDWAQPWREAFWAVLDQHERAMPLREAALQGRLGEWTKALTVVVVTTCNAIGWQASALGHTSSPQPVSVSEYLKLDVSAYAPNEHRWRFPIAVFEMENSRTDERVAYSLWKVLCVRAQLRVVFCYRRDRNEGTSLVKLLGEEVIGALTIEERMNLTGQTIVVIGSRDNSATFPNSFFRWWQLEQNTGTFRPM